MPRRASRSAIVLSILLGAGAAAAEPPPPAGATPPRVLAPEGAIEPVPPANAEPARPIASRNLSPRNDAMMAAYSATHNGDLSTRDLRLKAGAPILRGDGYGVALLLGYGVTELEFDGAARDQHLELHRFDATLGGGGAVVPGWSLRASFGLAHSSDLVDSTWSAWQVTASTMLQHTLGPSDALVFGAVYTSSSDLVTPVLPILGYVHQRAGSPLRFDVFLPRHIRGEYELHPRLRGALGVEVFGNKWTVQQDGMGQTAKRAGGAVFAELAVRATRLVRLELRLGMSVSKYTLPAEMAEPIEQPLRAAGFGQLALLIAP